MGRVRRFPPGDARFTAVFAAGAVVTITGYVLTGPIIRAVFFVVASLAALAPYLWGVRHQRGAGRVCWGLMIAGLTILNGFNLWWLWLEILGDPPAAADPAVAIFRIAGYLPLLAALVLLVARNTPKDAAGVIDATLIGVCAAAPLWEFVLRPALRSHGVDLSGQLTGLVQVLILVGLLAAVGRIAWTASRARTALLYLTLSVATTLVGVSMVTAVGSPGARGAHVPAGVCWLLGYLALGAAAAHPSVQHITAGDPPRCGPRPVRLGYLGAILCLTPVVGALPQLWGQAADGLLLCVVPLLVNPLVLTRIGQMVTQRARDQQTLAHLAAHDELTDLPNRRTLFTRVEEALQHPTGAGVAVLYCDLDQFKPVNDTFGHEAGDAVLRAVAGRLAGCLRAGEVAGRVGGDEFLVLCPDITASDAATLRARIERVLDSPVAWRGRHLRVGATVGLAVTTPLSSAESVSPTESVSAIPAPRAEAASAPLPDPRTDALALVGPDGATDPDGVAGPTELAGAASSADSLIAAADQDMYLRKRARRSRIPASAQSTRLGA